MNAEAGRAAAEIDPAPPADDADAERRPGAATETGIGTLGLALSGGGVRAALFALGVVIGLIATGCHRRVRCIASVSGGSILNAALAHASKSLRRFTPQDFDDDVAGKLAELLAQLGVFALGWKNFTTSVGYVLKTAITTTVALFLGAVGLLAGLGEQGVKVPVSVFSEVPWVPILVTALALVPVITFFRRRSFQEQQYAAVLRSIGKPPFLVSKWGHRDTEEEPESAVMHVLVATDLLSGQPMYFSGGFVHCQPYGWSAPEQLKTEAALYASAAFPVVFPPQRLRLRGWGRQLRFQNGDMAGKLPRTAKLADGGVFNNLGTDWFRILRRHVRETKPPCWPFGELTVTAPRIDRVLVVNAGAPGKRMQWLTALGSIPRTMSVLYDNTVKPRIELLKERRELLIDIRESPVELARRLADGANPKVKARAQALIERLEPDEQDEPFWSNLEDESAGTRTKLSRAGERAGARLMLHGYLSSLVLAHVLFGAPLPSRILGEEHFRKLASGELDAASQAAKKKTSGDGQDKDGSKREETDPAPKTSA